MAELRAVLTSACSGFAHKFEAVRTVALTTQNYLAACEAPATPVAYVTAARWEPDGQLVAAVLSSPRARRMADLPAPDRCWVVAGLTLAGLTAKDISERLGCSLRLVRSIRAEPMTQMCELMQRESDNFTNELRLAQSQQQITLRQLGETQSEAVRLKMQLERVLVARLAGEAITMCRQCGHPMDKWNTYEHSKTGKKACRNCHRERMSQRRAAERLGITVEEYRSTKPAAHAAAC